MLKASSCWRHKRLYQKKIKINKHYMSHIGKTEATVVRVLTTSIPQNQSHLLSNYFHSRFALVVELWDSGGKPWHRTFCLVSSSCHDKIQQTAWFKQQVFIFLQFWRLEFQDNGAIRIDFFWGGLLAYRQWPTLCALRWPFLCIHEEWKISGSASYEAICPMGLRSYLMTLYNLSYIIKSLISKYSHGKG